MYSGGSDEVTTLARYQWIVPRRVMCGLFWAGVALIFVGMVLLVTSQHKGQTFQSWGAVVLGLGLCILLSCVILCMHTYFVMSRRNREAQDGNAGSSKSHVNLMNASLTTTMIHGVPTEMLNGDRANRLARPPRYGISVVTSPPPTVRLYVSDIIDREQHPSPNDADTTPETIVIEHQSSSDHRTTSGDGCPTARCGESDKSTEDGETWRRRWSTTQPPDRRQTDASENSAVAVTQAPAFSDSNAVVAADAWLQHQQSTSRTVPLPFPPAHIKFDAFENDEIVPKHITSGLSSCDESFNQSTETIVARGDSGDKRTADSNARRKSVYYNAVANEASSNSESDTPGKQSSPVTLPRRTGSKRRRTELGTNNYTTATAKVKSKVINERRIISGGGGSSASKKVKEKPLRGRSDDQLSAPSAVTIDVHRGLPGTTTSTAAEHHQAKCRVTRIHLHSDHASDGPSAAPAPVASASAGVTWMSPSLSASATYSRTAFSDNVSLPAATTTLPTSTRGPLSRNGGGRGNELRLSAGDTKVGITAPTTTTTTSTTTATHDRRTDGVVPTTARTCGPACVTVTPLRSHVVPVEQCSRFPPPPPPTATSRTGRQHRQFDEEDKDDDAMKALDAVDLLRSEYEASFGGQVNPLLLYSGGLADEDVNLSKRTVYDNIQYFKV